MANLNHRSSILIPLDQISIECTGQTTGDTGNTGLKEEKAIWKYGSAYLPPKFIPRVRAYSPKVSTQVESLSLLQERNVYRTALKKCLQLRRSDIHRAQMPLLRS